MITGLTLGFSLLAGMAVGMAVRFASKVLMIISGVIVIALMFFQYHGWLNIQWDAIADSFNTAFESGKPAAQAFFTFIGNQFPKAALFGVGFYWAIRSK